MSPIVIINFSPFDVNLDFTFPSKCVYTDFNPDNLKAYYSAYRSTDLVRDHGSDYSSLNTYLQAYKAYIGIDDLEASLYGAVGKFILPAYQAGKSSFSVHQIEMDGSGTCFGKNSWKQFAISTADGNNVYELRDPSQSNWEITKFLGNGPYTVDIGRGGYLGAGWTVGYAMLGAALAILAAAVCVPVAAVTPTATGIGGLAIEVLDRMSLGFGGFDPGKRDTPSLYPRQETNIIQAGQVTLTRTVAENGTTTNVQVTVPDIAALQADETPTFFQSTPLFGFYDMYQRIGIDNRQACLLSKSAPMDQNCYVAGTSIIIQVDGTTVAYPLPDVSQAL